QSFRRSVAHEVKGGADQRQPRGAVEELRFGEFQAAAIREGEMMRERQVILIRPQSRGKLDNLPMKIGISGSAGQFKTRYAAPPGEPVEQGAASEDELVLLRFTPAVRGGDPLDEIPV